MRVLTCVTQRAGGRTYLMLMPHIEDANRTVGKMASYVAKAGNGLAKKKPDVAGKLILEQFPDLACVEVRAGTLSTKVLR
jgi:hypothetical protein